MSVGTNTFRRGGGAFSVISQRDMSHNSVRHPLFVACLFAGVLLWVISLFTTFVDSSVGTTLVSFGALYNYFT